MTLTKENKAQIQDLLRKLSKSRSFESADIATQIRKLVIPAPQEEKIKIPEETGSKNATSY